MTKTLTWKLIYFRKGQKSQMQPPPSFSSRFHVRARRSRRTEEDDALVTHIHGSLYPFEAQPYNSCLPSQQRSRKLKIYNRGTFATSTTDTWGWILVCPNSASNPNIATATFSPGGAVNHDAFANGAALSSTNSPYIASAFATDNLNVRFNSCSVRVRNITPMLNRGGTLYAVRTTNDQPLNSPAAGSLNTLISELDTAGYAVRCKTDGSGWSTLSWVPTDQDQMEFTTTNVPFSKAASNFMQCNMGFIASAPGITFPQTYEYEWVTHCEIIAANNSTEQLHGATRGISHHLATKANTILNDLQLRPKVIENTASPTVAGFITDAINAGHGVEKIISVAEDIIDRTAALAPRVIAATRALGAFL